MDDVDPQPFRERGPVAELDAQAVLGAMQHGLPMKPHDRDRLRVDRIFDEEGLDRLGVAVGDHFLGDRQHAGTRRAVLERRGLRQGPAQQRPVGVGIGVAAGRAEGELALSVRVDEGHVDPVHRRAGHEADRAIGRH